MRAMIIPGNNNTDLSEFWYPQVKKELEKLGLDVIAKNMPDPDLARKQYWLPFIKEQIKNDSNSIFIGHSSGAVAILRYLEENKAEGIVLVGVSHTNLNDEKEKISGYFNEPWNWERIRKNVKWIIQFASINDPYIPIAEARYIKDKLNSEYYEFTNRGHFMETGFQELVEAIHKKIG
jgi:predicted alpha/beta hydrolase family esterase